MGPILLSRNSGLVSITNLLSLDRVYFILIHDADALKPQYSGGGR